MNANAVGIRMQAGGTESAIVSAEGAHGVRSRIFADNRWRGVELKNSTDVDGLPMRVRWIGKTIGPGWLSLRAVLTNTGGKAIRLGSFHMLEGNSLGEVVKDPVVFIDTAGGWFAGTVKGRASCPPYLEKWDDFFVADEDIAWARRKMDGNLDVGAHHSLSGLLVYHRGEHLASWVLSFCVPMKRCSAAPVLLIDPDTGAVRSFALVNNFAGFELQPGRSIETETILLGRDCDSLHALEAWAAICAKMRRIKVHSNPPVGWLSWYGYRLTQNEADTIRTADLIRKEFDGLGFKYMQLDLGFNKGNLPGEWFEVNEKYPHGLKHLAGAFHERGFKFGVWLAPIFLAADCEFAREHPEALIKPHPRDAQQWYWEPHCDVFLLDATHPEGEKFLRRIVRHFKALGVCYFKFDFMNRAGRVDAGYSPYDKRMVRGIEVYRHTLKILMDELSKDDFVYWCSNLMHFGIGTGSTSMTACDIGNTGFETADKLAFFRQQATTTISRFYLHGKMLRLNADSLNVAPPADIEECRMRAALVAMSGGQMFLGDRFDLAEKDRFDIIRQVIPPYGHVARPLDLFENVYPDAFPRTWHLPVDTGWDRRDIVVLMNCERDMTITLDPDRLGLSPAEDYHVWEFWEQKYVGRARGRFSMALKCPSCRMAAIVPVRDYPWVLSTSFHFTQGALELAGVKWDARRGRLSGVLGRPKGSTGDIIIAAPPGCRCSLEEVADNIYRLPVVARAARTPWSVQFGTRA